jgi:hypothetical protein
VQVKRTIPILCCLFVVLAGAISVWANCKQDSFASRDHNGSEVPAHDHEHDANSNHDHSRNSVIHCLPLDVFLPSAALSRGKDHRVSSFLDVPVAEWTSRLADHYANHLIHGPPGFAPPVQIPMYLLLSVFRIRVPSPFNPIC